MTTYIALLRGVNVGGNNKIDMKRLKAEFESRGFANVMTYINSGNVIFDSDTQDLSEIKSVCEAVISERFGLTIAVNIISAADLLDAVSHTPDWWRADKDFTHNAIFVIPPMTAEEACAAVGEVNPENERIACHGRVIFWSASLKTYSRTRWSKVVGNKAVYNAITIRNANTTVKLAELINMRKVKGG
ncbi:MAG: DUF1697 domain-containing protein [Clostridiales bacterium]|jgi:uncharacterized protein (DUF1697 family)|nr:DUF1697 domain-containing protein [Clostridiales bacterium]